MRYVARGGRVYVVVNGRETERATALSANGRDLARFEQALRTARRQRDELAGVVRERISGAALRDEIWSHR